MSGNYGDDVSHPLLTAEDTMCLFEAFASKDCCPSLVYVNLTGSIKEPLVDMSEEAQLAIATLLFMSTTLRSLL
eukprot:2426061-Amphidinium_carterae.1